MIRAALCLTVLTVGGCSPPNRLFERVPFPEVSSLRCTFRTVHSGVLNPTYYRERSGDTLAFVFRELDAEAGTAKVEGNAGAANVEYRRTDDQVTVIETTMTGNTTMTTIFAPPEAGKPMPAVHSRHIRASPANVSISQFAGECR